MGVAVQHVGHVDTVVGRHRDRWIPAVLRQPDPDAASVVAVTDRAGYDDRPTEAPATVDRTGEPDAIAADPGNIHIAPIDGLLSLRVLARTAPADLADRPDVRPVPAEHGMARSGSTGRWDGGN